MSDEFDREAFRSDDYDRPPARPRREELRRREPVDDDDEPPRRSSNSGVKTVLIVLGLLAVLGTCLVMTVVIGLVVLAQSAVTNVRQAATKMQVANNYKQISIALINYHDIHNGFPPVAMKTKSGKPGLSWRVAILPYLDMDHLYKQFKLDEPWDHPENLRLVSQMPPVFAPLSGVGGDRTHVRVFYGPRAIFDEKGPSRNLAEIGRFDGVSQTIMLVESTDSVQWIKPDDLAFDSRAPLPKLGLPENDYFMVAYADGSVRPIQKSVNAEKIKLLVDYKDGQVVEIEP